MKKLVSILALALMLGACQNTAQNNNTAGDGHTCGSDSTGMTTLVD